MHLRHRIVRILIPRSCQCVTLMTFARRGLECSEQVSEAFLLLLSRTCSSQPTSLEKCERVSCRPSPWWTYLVAYAALEYLCLPRRARVQSLRAASSISSSFRYLSSSVRGGHAVPGDARLPPSKSSKKKRMIRQSLLIYVKRVLCFSCFSATQPASALTEEAHVYCCPRCFQV